MKMQAHPSRTMARGALVGFIAGAVVAGLGAHFLFPNQSQQETTVRESDLASSTPYEFTDPLITVSTGGANSPEYSQLQNQVQTYLNTEEEQGTLSSASVRFADIEAQEGFTINPDEQYDPASLTKIPLAMAYYDLAETDPSVLTQTIYYSGQPNLDADEQVESTTQLTPGQSYTVEAMIEHMIKYSDNNSEQLLANHLAAIDQLSVLSDLFTDLGIQYNPNPDDTTVGQYSLFLRVLFNATYLDRDYSEQLLKLMTESDFANGIDAGVPSGITVAEKFGDARIPNSQGVQVGAELQNCGIIYYPDHPYILCVMTKGGTVTGLEQVIANVSQILYKGVSAKYPQN